jgi:hypothetical protein
MNSNEFVNWLKGFVDACGEELSGEQLSKVKSSLENVSEVKCMERIQPSLPYPPNPYIVPQPHTGIPEIWCRTHTGGVSFDNTTTTT